LVRTCLAEGKKVQLRQALDVQSCFQLIKSWLLTLQEAFLLGEVCKQAG
jgi:hypothetical protein